MVRPPHRVTATASDADRLHVLEESATAALAPEAAQLMARAETATGYLRLQSAADIADATRVTLFDGERCVASGIVFRAEAGPLPRLTGLPPGDLASSVALADVFVDPGARALPVLLYLLLRRARIWERHTAVTHVEPSVLGSERDVIGWQPLVNVSPPFGASEASPRLAVAQRLDLAMFYACAALSPVQRAVVQRFFVPEAVETLEIHIDRFFGGEFFKAIYEGRLSREQYIYSMSNLHQFVRYTTRLIGRAVSLSNDEELRNHWLQHLSGEINHEKIIEKDLELLGADVDFVVSYMVPNVHNQQFMVVQESAIAFHQDPVLFMAAPFAAEGWTARLDQRFMDALDRCVRGWGIEQPRRVTGFLTSHINYDGGEDGHWEASRRILERYITSDQMLQRFTNLVHLAMNAFENSYASYVTEQRIWAAVPARPALRGAKSEPLAPRDVTA